MLAEKLKINPFFWMIIFLGIITGYFRLLILMFTIVLIHEIGHVIAAYHYRWRIKKIELLPFGGVAEVEEYGNRPFKEELVVVLAGPLQHIWMIAGAFLLRNVGWMDEKLFNNFIDINLMLFTFNLLPIWPLDGGKLLFLLLAKQLPYKKAHRTMLYSSLSILIFLLVLSSAFFPFQLNIWIIAIFLVISHYTEWKQQQFLFMRFLMERINHSAKETGKAKKIIVDPNMQIKDVLALFYKGCHHEVVIKGSYTFKKISEQTLLHTMFKENMPNRKMKDIMNFT
jgi:stage IV sporulation protein FB